MDNHLLIVISCLVTTASAALTITDGPQDTTVCTNQLADCTCGFSGADPNLVVPNWRIIKRNSNGVIVSDETIGGSDITSNITAGLEWIADIPNGSNSVLRVGPVVRADDQSSYQCIFSILSGAIESTIGILTVVDPPSIINLIVEDTGTTFITISWTSTSVGSVTYTITLSSLAGDVVMSSITDDTQYTINGLTSGTSYRISVVPSVGVCQGEGKEMMVDTTELDVSTSIGTPIVQPSSKTIILQATMTTSIKDCSKSDDDGNTVLIIVFTIVIVLLTISLVIAVVIIVWLCVERYHKLEHNNYESTNPLNQQQLNTDTIEMQPSPAYVPVDNPSSPAPQYETIQAPSDHQDVPMVDNPAYLIHKNI